MIIDFRAILIVVCIGLLVAIIHYEYVQDALAYVFLLGIATVLGLWMLRRWDLIMVYLFLFVGAVVSEVIMIWMGVWNYTEVHVIGFPIWLPFLWFTGAVFVGSMIALLRSRNV